jgi:hypothetical protein
MCAKGLLQPVYKTSRGPKHFPVKDIAALAEILGKKMGLPELAIIAMRALATAKANEQRLDDLLRIVGLKRKVLGTRPEEVASFYERTLGELEVPRSLSIEELEDWTSAFYAIDETYLSLVQMATASEEPWKPFLDLANRLANERAYARVDAVPELRSVYDYLETARRNLRVVSYMFCRERVGVDTADALFGKADLPDRLLSVMFSS